MLFRSIEIALAVCANFSVLVGPVVVWNLPATKTDPMAVGVIREWGCLCKEGDSSLCPAHVAVSHIGFLTERFGRDGRLPPDLPLFPNLEGTAVHKDKVVETIESMASRCGLPLMDSMGRKAFGGHSMRVAGARYLASLGIELVKIALMGRWGSDAVLRYVGEAPLLTLTGNCKQLLEGRSIESLLRELRAEVARGSSKIDAMENNVSRAVSEVELLKAKPVDGFVFNPTSGVWHEPVILDLAIAPSAWKTRCGWSFGYQPHIIKRSTDIRPESKRCERCLPPQALPGLGGPALSEDSE